MGPFIGKNKYRQDLTWGSAGIGDKSLYHFYGYTITQYFNQVLNER